MTASPLDAGNGTCQSDANAHDDRAPTAHSSDSNYHFRGFRRALASLGWENRPFVCVYVDRPAPGWWGAFIGRVPWTCTVVVAAAVAAAIAVALRFLPG